VKRHGRARKVGDNINTSYIIAGKRKAYYSIEDLAAFIMEDLDPNFAKNIQPGDFLVAGKNFGCGSSREEAPAVVKQAGFSAVIAKSVARIFHRSAINIGLPVVECDTDAISDKDQLMMDLETGSIRNETRDTNVDVEPMPRMFLSILKEGGLVPYILKHKSFKGL
jgi:3-isopropylmalate/(R)-2-methylmalate dehydratase small subunit